MDDGVVVRRRSNRPLRRRRGWSPELVAILAALVFCGIGAALYFGPIGGDLSTITGESQPTGETAAAGGAGADGAEAEGDSIEPVTASTASTVPTDDAADGAAEADGGSDETEADPGVGSEDANDPSSPSTSPPIEPDRPTTIPPTLTPDIDGSLEPGGVVLNGSVASLDGIGELVTLMEALTSGGSVDVSGVLVDPAAPPVRQLAVTVSTDQIGFAINSDVIQAEFLPILDRLVVLLQADQAVTMAVLGHTDAQGLDFENLALSQRRAEAVVEYLAAQGVNRFRMEPSGRGSTEPVADNATAEGRAQNRRIEFTIFGLDIT